MNNQGFHEFPCVVVAAAIIYQDGKFLLTKRKFEAHQGGMWEFPGGKLEVEETLEQCLRRELQEEIGVEVTKLKPLSVFRHRYPDQEVELHFFSCSIFQGNPTPLECLEIAWVPRGELSSYVFPEADQPVLREILHGKFRGEFST